MSARVLAGTWRAALAAAALCTPLVCAAQSRSVREPEPPGPIAARCLARVALADLRMAGSPRERDYRITAELLEVAWALTPADQTLLRMLIEAQANGGNSERVEELTRELIKLDNRDTVAQLRLISAGIRRLQSVGERLAAYDRWLGKEGDPVDPSVRSRLALDAALLAREGGDSEGFARRLTRAMQLDPSNRDAATLALTFFASRVDDPVGRFELMLAVLNAEPIDPDIHLVIAQHLARSGAFKGAARFFASFNGIAARLGIEPDEDERVEQDVVRWCVEGPRAMVERINRSIADARSSLARQRAERRRNDEPIDEVPEPESVRLSMNGEWFRTLASAALGDEDLLRPAIEEFIRTADLTAEGLRDPDKRPEGMTEEEATAMIRGLLQEAVLARLWTGRGLEHVRAGMDVLRADAAVDPAAMRRLEAWSQLRAGNLDAAEAALTALAPSDPFAEVGLCVAAELRADKAAAIERYTQAARRHAGTLPGAYAFTRAARLAGKPPTMGPSAERLETLAQAAPGWVDSIGDNPRQFQALDAAVEPLEVRMLDGVRMTITLRNASPIPLGVGPDRTINSRLLVAPQVQVATIPLPAASMIQVVSMERRLRLMPREELQATVWPDAGPLGMLLDHIFSRPARVRYRVLQAFEMTGENMYDAGPFGLSVECDPVVRPASIRALADAAAIKHLVETGTPREMVEGLLLLRGRSLPGMGLTPLSEEEQREVFTAAGKRFATLEPAWQLLVLAVAPPGVQMPTVEPLDQAALTSAHPGVLTVLMALRVANADHPILDDRAYPEHPSLARVAALVKARLKDGAISYPTYDPQPPPPPEPEPSRPAQER